jgi:hypothetical protein
LSPDCWAVGVELLGEQAYSPRARDTPTAIKPTICEGLLIISTILLYLFFKTRINHIQKKYNTSSIIITHDVDCARVISNRMILLIDKINYAEGTFKELSVSEDPKIKAFFK